MKSKLKKSEKKESIVSITTKYPDGDAYDGIILRFNKNIIVFQDTDEFSLKGVSILPRKWVVKVRNGEQEKCYEKILRLHGEIKGLNRTKWVNELHSIKSAIKTLYKRGIWPAIEVFNGKKRTAMFLGPITEIESRKFTIFSYDSCGKWEREYCIKYSEVFCIQLFNQYTEYFNNFMKVQNKKSFKNHCKKHATN